MLGVTYKSGHLFLYSDVEKILNSSQTRWVHFGENFTLSAKRGHDFAKLNVEYQSWFLAGIKHHTPKTIPLQPMYLKKLQRLQFWCFQRKVQIGIREHFYQDFRAKLRCKRSYFCFFHFSLYCYLIMQCRSKVRFFWGGQSRVPKAWVARGSWGMLPRKILKYSFQQFLTVEAINK